LFGKRSDQPRTSEDRARAAAERAARRSGRALPPDAFEHSVRPPDVEPRSVRRVERTQEPPEFQEPPPRDEPSAPEAPAPRPRLSHDGEIDWGTAPTRDATADPAPPRENEPLHGAEAASRRTREPEARRTPPAGAEAERTPSGAAPAEVEGRQTPREQADVGATPGDATPAEAEARRAPRDAAPAEAEAPRDPTPPEAEAPRDATPAETEARNTPREPAPAEPSQEVHQPTVEYTPSFNTEEHELFGEPRDGEPELIAGRQQPEPEPEPQPEEPLTEDNVIEPRPLRPAPAKPAAGDEPRKRPAPNAPKRRNKRVTPPPPRAPRSTGEGRGPVHWGRRFFALILLLAILALFYVINATFQPFHGDGDGSVKVTIPENASASDVGKLLEAKQVIDSARFFQLKATISGDRDKLRPGSYTLKKGMKNGDALAVITKVPETKETPVETVKLTIVEGPSRKENAKVVDDSKKVEGSYAKASSSKEVLARIRKLGAPKGTKTAEGFLFPATYEVPKGSKASVLVDQQLDAFEQNFGQIDMKYAKSKNLSRYDVLIIASMIEREAQLAKERPLVSAVIYNRLKEGMPLGIDATIRYYTNNWTRPILQSQLQKDEPYNLSLNRGLPPTPIGNPGLASMKAAAKPSKKDYLYYVRKANDKSGEHAFSSTESEFAKDLQRYNESRKGK